MSIVERLQYYDLEGIRVGRFTSRLNTTCILYRLGSTVVDTGPPNQWRYVRRFLEERKVRRVLVTHHHEDHSGNLKPIRRQWNPELLAPETGRAMLANGFQVQTYRRVVWGKPQEVETRSLPQQLELESGVRLRPIHTPGHSPDSTCFLAPGRGWLFTGDLYIAARTRYLRQDEDVGGYISGLRRVLEEDFQTVICSHRGVLEQGREALRRKLDNLITLCEQARDLRELGLRPAEISSRLMGREDHLAWISRGHFCKRNLVESCLVAVDRGVV